MLRQATYFIALLIFFLPAKTLAGERADSLLINYLRGEGLAEYTADSITVFTNGADKFEAMFADIRAAKKTIDVEYFIFANDSIARLTLDVLREAAGRGVKVRLIIDGYKDHERGYGYEGARVDSLNREGISTFVFDPWRHPYLAHVPRDHKKIVVIDDEIGYIGGLNVADYYVVGKPEVYGGWRDTHVRIKGEAARGMTRLFEKSLVMIETGCYKGEIPEGTSDNTGNTQAAQGLSEKKETARKGIVYFERSRESRKKKAETRNAIIAALDCAKDTIRLVSPYFLPTHTVRKALVRAIDKGIHVEVLFSKVGDMPVLSVGNYHFAKKMHRHGAEIFLYKGAFHHSKIMMVDGRVAMVGSANLNSRSLKWDYEASCFIFDPETTAELSGIFEADKRESDEFTMELYRKLPLGKRIYGWFVDRFLTPIL